jgi:hypothetical protein
MVPTDSSPGHVCAPFGDNPHYRQAAMACRQQPHHRRPRPRLPSIQPSLLLLLLLLLPAAAALAFVPSRWRLLLTKAARPAAAPAPARSLHIAAPAASATAFEPRNGTEGGCPFHGAAGSSGAKQVCGRGVFLV